MRVSRVSEMLKFHGVHVWIRDTTVSFCLVFVHQQFSFTMCGVWPLNEQLQFSAISWDWISECSVMCHVMLCDSSSHSVYITSASSFVHCSNVLHCGSNTLCKPHLVVVSGFSSKHWLGLFGQDRLFGEEWFGLFGYTNCLGLWEGFPYKVPIQVLQIFCFMVDEPFKTSCVGWLGCLGCLGQHMMKHLLD